MFLIILGLLIIYLSLKSAFSVIILNEIILFVREYENWQKRSNEGLRIIFSHSSGGIPYEQVAYCWP